MGAGGKLGEGFGVTVGLVFSDSMSCETTSCSGVGEGWEEVEVEAEKEGDCASLAKAFPSLTGSAAPGSGWTNVSSGVNQLVGVSGRARQEVCSQFSSEC